MSPAVYVKERAQESARTWKREPPPPLEREKSESKGHRENTHIYKRARGETLEYSAGTWRRVDVGYSTKRP